MVLAPVIFFEPLFVVISFMALKALAEILLKTRHLSSIILFVVQDTPSEFHYSVFLF